MVREARELGFDSCVAVCQGNIPEPGDFRVLHGWIVSEQSVKAAMNRMRKAPAGDLVMVDAGDAAFNRGILSTRGIHILRGIHRSPPRSLDHVSARLAARREVAIDIELYPLLHERKGGRQKVLQRYEDVLQLHRRFRFPLTISSGARSILDQRSVREITSLCSLFRMGTEEVFRALATCGEILERKGPVEEV
jgi:ribonuclease P/MRP protein subunit RPP1